MADVKPIVMYNGQLAEINASDDLAVEAYFDDIGDNASTTLTVTHNLGTRDVDVTLREIASPYEHVGARVKSATTNTVTLEFSVAPTTDQYRIKVSRV